MTLPDWDYRGRLKRGGVSGGQIDLVLSKTVDLGFETSITYQHAARLVLATPADLTKPLWLVSNQAVNQWLYFAEEWPWDDGWPLRIVLGNPHTISGLTAGYLAHLWAPNSHDQESLNEWLVRRGFAQTEAALPGPPMNRI